MKKFIWGVIAGAAIMLMVMYCSTESHQMNTWHAKKKEVIKWERLDTFRFSFPEYSVVYPDYFIPDSSMLLNGNMKFDYEFEGHTISLRTFSIVNDGLWDRETVADSIASYRAQLTNDTITMIDMHPGYFYLEGHSKGNRYKFFEQYVIQKDYLYNFELAYSPELTDEQIKRLKELVHEWSPK